MVERSVSVASPLGLHARAAARFVQTAARFRSSVTVRKNGTAIDGKSILGVLFLAATYGTTLVISTAGDDEGEALEALVTLVQSGLGDHE